MINMQLPKYVLVPASGLAKGMTVVEPSNPLLTKRVKHVVPVSFQGINFVGILFEGIAGAESEVSVALHDTHFNVVAEVRDVWDSLAYTVEHDDYSLMRDWVRFMLQHGLTKQQCIEILNERLSIPIETIARKIADIELDP